MTKSAASVRAAVTYKIGGSQQKFNEIPHYIASRSVRNHLNVSMHGGATPERLRNTPHHPAAQDEEKEDEAQDGEKEGSRRGGTRRTRGGRKGRTITIEI